jgi:hypothetical protein
VRIVVSGTHASGKSTLVSDLVTRLPGHVALPDPFELVDVDDPASAHSFVEQLEASAERLVELRPGAEVVAERGPVDFLAYLEALRELGRRSVAPDSLAALRATAAEAMAHVDLLVVLPLDPDSHIWVPEEEDLDLRDAMDRHLLDLCADEEVLGPVVMVLEVTGPPARRVGDVLAAVAARGAPRHPSSGT